MRGLFLKIFAIFWLAQSLIFIITTTLIVRQHFASPNTVSDALDNNLRHDASAALADFTAGGCPFFRNNAARNEPSISSAAPPTRPPPRLSPTSPPPASTAA